MTRRLAASLAATLLVSSVAFAPDPQAKAALPHMPSRPAANHFAFDVHLGDGIFRVRIRGGESCETTLTLEIRIPGLLETSVGPARPQ